MTKTALAKHQTPSSLMLKVDHRRSGEGAGGDGGRGDVVPTAGHASAEPRQMSAALKSEAQRVGNGLQKSDQPSHVSAVLKNEHQRHVNGHQRQRGLLRVVR